MRRSLIVAAVLLVAAAGGYAAYWYSAARTLAGAIESWATDQRRAGYDVAYAEPEIGGFPFRLEARIADPAIAAPPDEIAWRWRGPALLLHARPWAPLDFRAEAPGRHEIALDEGGTARRYLIDAEGAVGDGSFALDGRLSEAGLALSGVRAVEAGREDEPVTFDAIDVRVTPDAEVAGARPSLGILVALDGMALPPSAEAPLGRVIDTLEIEGALVGELPEIEDDMELEAALAAWRDDGGTLEVTRLVLYWGALELTGSGTFALDRALQPIGAMSATVSGHDAVIDALVADGTVSPRDGSLAKVVLSVLAQPSPVDGQPELTAPISLQDGFVWLGPAKLAPLPRIDCRRQGKLQRHSVRTKGRLSSPGEDPAIHLAARACG